MKIIIFYDNQLADQARTIYTAITKTDITAVLCEASAIWDEKQHKNPTNIFLAATHVLFVYPPDEHIQNPAFLFFSGLAVGMDIEILILSTGNTINIPKNCRHLGSKIRFSNLEHYLAGEKRRMKIIEKQNTARQALEERGYSCFDRNFILAVEANELDIIRLFLEAGFNPSLSNADGTPVLSIAVRNSFYNAVVLLVESGADVNAVSDDRSYTALMDAAQIGAEQTVKFLLEHHAITNVQSKDGQTALILAVGRQDASVAALLYKHHADPEIKDKMGMSASGYAKLFRNTEVLSALGMHPV